MPAKSGEWIITQEDIDRLFYKFCGYAVYSHADELKHGFISLGQKYRVGVSGMAVTENGVFHTVRNVTSLSIRIPRNIYGCAEALFRKTSCINGGILIAGEPSSGKTTLLRDLARCLGHSHRTVVIDERYELYAKGYDLGACTDVLQGYPKRDGISHALRCMSPEYIICDELDNSDLDSIHSAFFSGVSLIATVHAGSEEEVYKRELCRILLREGAFSWVAVLKGRSEPSVLRTVIKAGDFFGNDRLIDFDCLHNSDRFIGSCTDEDACSGITCVL